MLQVGHAPVFVHPTKASEAIVEKQTAEEFGLALNSEVGVQIDEIKNCTNPNNDFPDCEGLRHGNSVSIELTELVRGHLRGKPNVRWKDKQWNIDKFRDQMSCLIQKKIAKSRFHNVVLDYLVIHSNEEWISPVQAEEWLSGLSFYAERRIHEAFFLQFYVPGWRDHWPIHKIALNNRA